MHFSFDDTPRYLERLGTGVVLAVMILMWALMAWDVASESLRWLL